MPLLRSPGRTAVLAATAGLLAACSGDATGPRQTLWQNYGALPQAATGYDLAVSDDQLVIATSDGIWRTPLGEPAPWQRVTATGATVSTLATIERDGVPAVLVAGLAAPGTALPVRRSLDGGDSWTEFGAGLAAPGGGSLPVTDLAVHEDAPFAPGYTLYAAVGGDAIARSNDGGESWTLVRGTGSTQAAFDCLLHVRRNTLYQACEATPGAPTLRGYDVTDRTQAQLGQPAEVLGTQALGGRTVTFLGDGAAADTALYVGLEGGLLRYSDGAATTILDASGGGAIGTPSVTSVWVDRFDRDHLIIGAGRAGDPATQSGAYETFDGGSSFQRVSTPIGLDFGSTPVVRLLPVDDAVAFLVQPGTAPGVVLRFITN